MTLDGKNKEKAVKFLQDLIQRIEKSGVDSSEFCEHFQINRNAHLEEFSCASWRRMVKYAVGETLNIQIVFHASVQEESKRRTDAINKSART